jgi:hypothetical protein
MAVVINDRDLESHIKNNGKSRNDSKKKKTENLNLPPISNSVTVRKKATTAPTKTEQDQQPMIVRRGRILDDLEVRG